MSDIYRARSRVAVEERRARRGKPGAQARVVDARRDLAAAKLEAYIATVVADAPRLTTEQRVRLQTLLSAPRHPGGGA